VSQVPATSPTEATIGATALPTMAGVPTFTQAPASLAPSATPTPRARPAPTSLSGPDGVVVFAGDRDGDFDIWAMLPDGTGISQITRGPARERSPSVSADGSRIVYAVGRDGGRDIWLIDGRGAGRPQRLTKHRADDYEPAISPDGLHIAWVSDRTVSGHNHIFLMTDVGYGFREGGAVDLTSERLTAGNHSRRPSWFPDSQRIAFQTNDFDSPDIWSVDLEGNREWWTRDLRGDFGPAVGPDGAVDFIHEPQRFGPDYLYRVAKPHGPTRKVSDLRNPQDLDYSPDMQRLVVERGDDLLTMSRGGEDRRTVRIPDMSDPTEPEWVGSVFVPRRPR
jgi:hypothetical protein